VITIKREPEMVKAVICFMKLEGKIDFNLADSKQKSYKDEVDYWLKYDEDALN
jgi:hypothetical protein